MNNKMSIERIADRLDTLAEITPDRSKMVLERIANSLDALAEITPDRSKMSLERIADAVENYSGGGGGGQSWTTLTEEIADPSLIPGMDYASADLEYSQIINTDSIRVTLNGTAYVCQRSVDEYEGNVYGATESSGTYDWSEFPFQIWSGDDDGIVTTLIVPTAGTYNIKIEAPQSGGGSSDFSTATVTIDGDNDSAYAYFTCATYSDEGTYANADGASGDSVGVVLYKGVAICEISCDSSFTTSGNIEYSEDWGAYLITGDCTITIS